MKTKSLFKPTTAQFAAYQRLFDYFNSKLFNNELPQCLLNLSRMSRAHGFFAPGRWNGAEENGRTLHEISLNPDSIARAPKDVLGTLVHEMCHLWQQELGKPPRRAYHDKQFAAKMKEVGLQPTSVPGGKETGQHLTHVIIPSGRYEVAFYELPQNLLLPFKAAPILEGEKKKSKNQTKTKYMCSCGNSVWGKADLNILCEDCDEKYISEDLDNEGDDV